MMQLEENPQLPAVRVRRGLRRGGIRSHVHLLRLRVDHNARILR